MSAASWPAACCATASSLTVRDLDPAGARPLADAGAQVGDSPAALAACCDVVITCLPSPAASRAVLEAGDGVLAGLTPGTIWAEMSTTDEAEVRRLGALVAGEGRRAGRLPRLRRLPPGRDRQHRDFRRRRARGLRTVAARAQGHGPADSPHRPTGLGLGAQGGDQLSRHGEPRLPVRGAGDREDGRHGPQHGLRGDPHLLGQLLRPRDGKPGHPQRQPRHQLHHGPGLQGHRHLRRDCGARRRAAGNRAAADRHFQGRRGPLRPARMVAQHRPAARGRLRHRHPRAGLPRRDGRRRAGTAGLRSRAEGAGARVSRPRRAGNRKRRGRQPACRGGSGVCRRDRQRPTPIDERLIDRARPHLCSVTPKIVISTGAGDSPRSGEIFPARCSDHRFVPERYLRSTAPSGPFRSI